MFIQFNEQQVHLQVICGIAENYKPTKEIKDITKKVEKLKKKLEKFNQEITPELLEIRNLIETENKKHFSEELKSK